MKTTLTVDIEYDPKVTDPDILASAMDRLITTALSTPGILDEYENPSVGSFFVVQERGVEHFVLCDLDGRKLATTNVYAKPAEAAADANELNDVILVPIWLPSADDEQSEVVDDADGDDEDDPRCDCEQPGYFYSDVPGIIARVEDGVLAEGATVERCDACERYPSDEAAYQKLVELGIAPPKPSFGSGDGAPP